MTAILSKSTGVEELLDAVEEVLIRDLNSKLDEVYERQEAADIARAQRRDVPYEPIEYEYVTPNHFFQQNFPSIVLDEVAKETYPYIVMATEGYTPDAESARDDHKNIYNDTLVIHTLAKASKDEGSEIVFRRAIRMGEAVFISLMSDPGMQRRLMAASNPVRGQSSIPWVAPHKGRGDNWWYQSVGTQYTIKSYTSFYQ